jgi:hypothetical protein
MPMMKSHVAITIAANIIEESNDFGLEEEGENVIVFLVSYKIKEGENVIVIYGCPFT